ncbi:MAG: TIGR00730 family Rossman fold protein [Gemmataceae bacterium]|nr:TIGR00730 family Rossman fold protein [Gemmataceae bacterium]MDW8265336.1 TIGR00730 family Rossman fold protein [Gemmataceae bacterium]
MRRVAVFCGSKVGARACYAEAARRLGTALAARRWGLVYGAGHIGLMGILADAVLQAGGEVIGVIPKALVDRELAHTGLTQIHVVRSMHERKAVMADLSDAFIALPGGYGTADELFEILTWAQLGFHAKPIGLLDVEDFFAPLRDWLDRAVAEGFLSLRHRRLLREANDPELLLEEFARFHAEPESPRWLADTER